MISSIFSQSGVIPFRVQDKTIEILLITSISGKNWIFPKGIVEFGLTPEESAVKEAFEEAGIRGELIPQSIGKYTFKKWGGMINVVVFPFRVSEICDNYPESDLRERKWFRLEEAKTTVHRKELKEILESFESWI